MRKIIYWFNASLILSMLMLIVAAIGIKALYSHELLQPKVIEKAKGLPKYSFQQKPEGYKAIEEPVFELQYATPNLSLPDLRSFMTYYGPNKRPDAKRSTSEHYFSFGDARDIVTVKPNTPTYLIRNKATGKYSLSPNNQETPVWFSFDPLASGVKVKLQMKGVDDTIISEPKDRAQFVLAEKPLAVTSQTPWTLDNTRVDGSLLIRQKVKWSGPDLFLAEHGGQEFESLQGKQRIDFGEGEELYSLFANPGDYFIWKEHRWQVPDSNEETQNYPLLEIKTVQDRLMSSELWSPGGKNKITLNILRLLEPVPQSVDLSKKFQFLGARTRTHFMFNVEKKREIVGVEDWFIETKEGWQKLNKTKDVDAYVSRNLIGPLLVINSIGQQQQDKFLRATLYNASRSDSVQLELPLKVAPKAAKKVQEKPVEEVEEQVNEEFVPNGEKAEPVESKGVQPENNAPADSRPVVTPNQGAEGE